MLNHIVIMGGGFSGSLAAIACSKLADQITLIERSPFSYDRVNSGTPQAHHVHIFSKSGQSQLEQIVPGILDQLREKGAVEADWAKNTLWEGRYGTYQNYESGIKSLLFSRKLLDNTLLERVRALPNIHLISSSVKDINFSHGMISEIHLSNGKILSNADLYLEARGRSSPLKEILEELVGSIPEKIITNKIRYTTAVIDRPAAGDQSHEIKQFYRQANSQNQPLGYYVSPIEGDKTIFTAVDYHGNVKNPFGHFKNHPALANRTAQNPKSFSKLHNVHNMYGKSKKWPKNLLVIGEAVCRLNPVHGHGLTICTEQIDLLVKSLASSEKFNSHRLQKKIDETVRFRWLFVAMDEMRSPEKPFHIGYALGNLYLDWISWASIKSISIHKMTLEVLHGLKSPFILMTPLTFAKLFVIWLQAITAYFKEDRSRVHKKASLGPQTP